MAVFIQSFAPPPRMYVFGAIDFASAVARIGKFMGYRVIGLRRQAPSSPPASGSRRADEIVVAWPDEFLKTAEVDKTNASSASSPTTPSSTCRYSRRRSRREAGYIGAMGSRRTHDNRTARLKEEGVTDEQLARISSPIGLDIGARTPEETAIAIAGEIIALQDRAFGRTPRRAIRPDPRPAADETAPTQRVK